jgi:hypothetical protein
VWERVLSNERVGDFNWCFNNPNPVVARMRFCPSRHATWRKGPPELKSDSDDMHMCKEPVATDQSDHCRPAEHRTSCFKHEKQKRLLPRLDKKKKLIQRPSPL